ncbi:MAG: hypothetical protein RL268_1768 [Pseudomonadota bacterium]
MWRGFISEIYRGKRSNVVPLFAGAMGATVAEISKERIGAISDGVIAVAATLLVLELDVPDGVSMSSELVFHWSRVFAAWIISFVMVVVVWLDNHMFLSKAREWSLSLTVLTFFQLAAASLIPFASNLVIDHYDSRGAMFAFNGVMALNGLVSYAISRRLAGSDTFLEDPQTAIFLRRRGERQLLIYAFVLTLATMAGHVQHPLFGVVFWALSPILIAVTTKRARSRKVSS